jgi:hypothetical protein
MYFKYSSNIEVFDHRVSLLFVCQVTVVLNADRIFRGSRYNYIKSSQIDIRTPTEILEILEIRSDLLICWAMFIVNPCIKAIPETHDRPKNPSYLQRPLSALIHRQATFISQPLNEIGTAKLFTTRVWSYRTES